MQCAAEPTQYAQPMAFHTPHHSVHRSRGATQGPPSGGVVHAPPVQVRHVPTPAMGGSASAMAGMPGAVLQGYVQPFVVSSGMHSQPTYGRQSGVAVTSYDGYVASGGYGLPQDVDRERRGRHGKRGKTKSSKRSGSLGLLSRLRS